MKESELEAKLGAFAPARPSPDLEERIAAALHGNIVPISAHTLPAKIAGTLPRANENGWARLFYGIGGACAGAACAVVATTYSSPASGSAPRPSVKAIASAVFEPAASEQVLISTENTVVYGADNEPTQLVRYSSIERHSWTNTATGARIEVEAPREDVVLEPVNFQ
jgi:hypothetical protein